jgi:outer membrane receptor protein involved in Fe transport
VTGDHIPGAIETAASASATLRELGGWTASLYTRYFGPRPLVEDDSVRSSASTIVNAQATYAITQWARLTLDVFNLLNAQVDDIAYFYKSRLPGEPATGVADVHFHPAESRGVRLTTVVSF